MSTGTGRTTAIIGLGRAGGALQKALPTVGWTVARTYVRGDDLTAAAAHVDLVLIATDDASIAAVAAQITPGRAVVAHVAGSVGLDALADYGGATAAVHPLMVLPDADLGAERLLAGGWFATAGDPIVDTLVGDLGGRHVAVADEDRATYHATAAVAANHIAVLLGQVERLAATIGVPAEPFLDLAAGSLDAVRARGAQAALTGPAARGDQVTLDRHLAALAPTERELYRTLMEAAIELAAATNTDTAANTDTATNTDSDMNDRSD